MFYDDTGAQEKAIFQVSRRAGKQARSTRLHRLGPLDDVENHGEFSYMGPGCWVSFRHKFTCWNAHALKGIADVFG